MSEWESTHSTLLIEAPRPASTGRGQHEVEEEEKEKGGKEERREGVQKREGGAWDGGSNVNQLEKPDTSRVG